MAEEVIETPAPAPDAFKAAVQKQRDALANETQALRTLLNTPGTPYEGLPLNEKMRLSRQFSAMGILLEVLNERLLSDFQ